MDFEKALQQAIDSPDEAEELRDVRPCVQALLNTCRQAVFDFLDHRKAEGELDEGVAEAATVLMAGAISVVSTGLQNSAGHIAAMATLSKLFQDLCKEEAIKVGLKRHDSKPKAPAATKN